MPHSLEGEPVNFAAYMVGIVLVICGLAYGAYLVGVPQRWIAIGVVVLIGLGIMGAVTKTRRRDPN
jgi:hypothetical protein